jgi:hypothetical protein
MTVDYKSVNGTQVAVICDIENAELSLDEWKKFGDMVCKRYEDMLPTVTILGVDYPVLKRIIESRTKDTLLAHVITGRLWEMGVKKIEYLPASAQPQIAKKPVESPAPAEKVSKVRDYCINGGRGFNCKTVYQLDGNGNIIREFPSVKAAAAYYSLSKDALSQCLRGKTKTCGGRIWRYKEA